MTLPCSGPDCAACSLFRIGTKPKLTLAQLVAKLRDRPTTPAMVVPMRSGLGAYALAAMAHQRWMLEQRYAMDVIPEGFVPSRVHAEDLASTYLNLPPLADVIEVGSAVVIVACDSLDKPGTLHRPAQGYTLWVMDFPTSGYWQPRKGLLVVPREQLRIVAED